MEGRRLAFCSRQKKSQLFSKAVNVSRALVFKEKDALGKKKIPSPPVEKKSLSACDQESGLHVGDSARTTSGQCGQVLWGHPGLSEKLQVFPGIGKGSSGSAAAAHRLGLWLPLPKR